MATIGFIGLGGNQTKRDELLVIAAPFLDSAWVRLARPNIVLNELPLLLISQVLPIRAPRHKCTVRQSVLSPESPLQHKRAFFYAAPFVDSDEGTSSSNHQPQRSSNYPSE